MATVTHFLYIAIKIPQTITLTISRLISLFLSYMNLFKSSNSDDQSLSSGAGNYILILDGSSPSLLPVPVHVITDSIKNRVAIVTYSDFVQTHGGVESPVCTVCLECVCDCDLIRELCNCKHVFHHKCLDRWVELGHVNCPLCRSMLLPKKK
ncbi:hypothetical protein QVD17_13601 [Tagetes erecta]|uniref:RING-type domain-containing protein n=1 Tax=Tagetes erecta TaxID=13708 RepID=A0AAD8L2C7_TARER|nr:hypothetical protein QVD17_13601 [Tagetes erecta]